MVQPGSFAVPLAGLAAAFAKGLPWTGSGNWWLLTSLVLFLSLAPMIPLIYLPRGRVFEAALATARDRGRVTPELRAAFGDSLVSVARIYEVAVVGDRARAHGDEALLIVEAGRHPQ